MADAVATDHWLHQGQEGEARRSGAGLAARGLERYGETQMRKFPPPGPLVAGESITAAAENVDDVTFQDLGHHSLEVPATKCKEQGLVPFFGCSTCRFSSSSCRRTSK